MKEEALKLADLMIDVTDSETSDFHKSGQMIRKLVAENDNLFKALIAEQEHNEMLVAELDKAEPAILDAFNSGKGVGYVDGMRAMKREPLSDEEIKKLAINDMHSLNIGEIEFIRLVLERHGIK